VMDATGGRKAIQIYAAVEIFIQKNMYLILSVIDCLPRDYLYFAYIIEFIHTSLFSFKHKLPLKRIIIRTHM